jgi:hypothetical protein
MKTITKQELIDYINSQPDDKRVDMRQCSVLGNCGCVMVQYSKEILNITDPFWCGYHVIYVNNFPEYALGADDNIDDIIDGDHWDEIETYADVRKFLKN